MVISLKIRKPATKLNLLFYKNYGIIKIKRKKYTKVEKRIHDFLPEVKDYYVITSDGEIISDNSGKMKTRNRAGTEYQIINLSLLDGKKKLIGYIDWF